jgi:hypothetical protein
MIDLDTFLQMIDPSVVIDPVQRRADEAFNSYWFASISFSDRAGFECIISDFFWHLERAIMEIDNSTFYSLELWALPTESLQVLQELYGFRGPEIAFERANSGVDGGLYRVLRDMTDHQVKRHVDKQIRYLVQVHRWSFSDGLIPAASEYQRRFQHLMPELKTHRPMELATRLEELLINHPWMIKRMRSLGRV